ncbi:hypothetical protein BH09MYX1_BH09MYX1_63000 [soil metagenome]
MRPWLAKTVFLGTTLTVLGACATAAVSNLAFDGGTTTDSGTIPEAGGDGGCSPACKSTEVCSNGVCKAQCDAPLVKCAGDAGVCVDTTKDPKNCGQCGTSCTLPDGGPEGGAGNPDSGLPPDDGGASTGWAIGTAACTSSKCAIACGSGSTLCTDSLCWDTQNAHEHCGSCTTACQAAEHCTKGACCAFGQASCNGTCTDLLSNNGNCGACGNVCSGGTPFCSGGACTVGVSYSQAFVQGATPGAQCTSWTSFRASLTGTYTTITVSGTNDVVGRTCTGAGANTLCQALRNAGTVTNLACGGFTWNVGACGRQPEVSAQGGLCACTSPTAYTVRPCIGNSNWGGVNSLNCNAPSQTLNVICK